MCRLLTEAGGRLLQENGAFLLWTDCPPETPVVPPSGGGVFQQPPRRLLPPIIGRAFTGQGRQSVRAKFGLTLNARGKTAQGSSWVDAEGFLTADAVVEASQGQTVSANFWSTMMAGVRTSQAEHKSDVGMSIRLDLIVRSGGDAIIVPNYSDDPLQIFEDQDDAWS